MCIKCVWPLFWSVTTFNWAWPRVLDRHQQILLINVTKIIKMRCTAVMELLTVYQMKAKLRESALGHRKAVAFLIFFLSHLCHQRKNSLWSFKYVNCERVICFFAHFVCMKSSSVICSTPSETPPRHNYAGRLSPYSLINLVKLFIVVSLDIKLRVD